MNDQITALLAANDEAHTLEWYARFSAAVLDAECTVTDDPPAPGPDGCPYLFVFTPHEGAETTPFRDVMQKALDAGAGIAVNPAPEGVDWVFFFGDLVALESRGTIVADDWKPQAAPEIRNESEEVGVGQPSEDYLPPRARAALRSYLADDAGVDDPRVLLMSRPAMPPGLHLVFSFTPSEIGDDDRFAAIMQKVTWYLPRDYSVVTVDSRDGPHEHAFAPL